MQFCPDTSSPFKVKKKVKEHKIWSKINCKHKLTVFTIVAPSFEKGHHAYGDQGWPSETAAEECKPPSPPVCCVCRVWI